MYGRNVGRWLRTYRNTYSRVKVVSVFLLAIAALVLAAMGGSGCSRSSKTGHSASNGGANSPIGESGTEPRNEPTETPDPVILALLTKELQRQLAALPQDHNPVTEGYGRPRAVGYEADYSGMYSEEDPEFVPSARVWLIEGLTGDYDGDGEVGIPDLTPIALNYLKTVEYLPLEADEARSDWNGVRTPAGDPRTPEGAANWRLAQIDGDGNGEIGISDVTPIALHYLARLEGWRISIVIYQNERESVGIAPVTGAVWPRQAGGGSDGLPVRSAIELPQGSFPVLDVEFYYLPYELRERAARTFTFEVAPEFSSSSVKAVEIGQSDIYCSIAFPNPNDREYGSYLLSSPIAEFYFDYENCPGSGILTIGPKVVEFFGDSPAASFKLESSASPRGISIVPEEAGIRLSRPKEDESARDVFECLDGLWSNNIQDNGDEFVKVGIENVIAKMPDFQSEPEWWRMKVSYIVSDRYADSVLAYLPGRRFGDAIIFERPNRRYARGEIRKAIFTLPISPSDSRRLRLFSYYTTGFALQGLTQISEPEITSAGDSITIKANLRTRFNQSYDSVELYITPLEPGNFELKEGYLDISAFFNEDAIFEGYYPYWVTKHAAFHHALLLNNFHATFLEYGQLVRFSDGGSERHFGYYAKGNIAINSNSFYGKTAFRYQLLDDQGETVNLLCAFREPVPPTGGPPNPGGNNGYVVGVIAENKTGGDDWNVSLARGYYNTAGFPYWLIENAEFSGIFSGVGDLIEEMPEATLVFDANSRIAVLDFGKIPAIFRYSPDHISKIGESEVAQWEKVLYEYDAGGTRFIVPCARGLESLRVYFRDKLSINSAWISEYIAFNIPVQPPPNKETAAVILLGDVYTGTLFPGNSALIHADNPEAFIRIVLNLRIPRQTVIWFWRDTGTVLEPIGWSYDGVRYQEDETLLSDGVYFEICALPGLVNPEGEEFTISFDEGQS